MIFDTDILIRHAQGDLDAARAITKAESRQIALQTALEYLQGSSSNVLMSARRSFLHDLEFEILPLTANIGHRALIYIEAHALADGLRSADALIAATAVENDEVLCTGNGKHFKAIKELKLKVLKGS